MVERMLSYCSRLLAHFTRYILLPSRGLLTPMHHLHHALHSLPFNAHLNIISSLHSIKSRPDQDNMQCHFFNT